MTADAGPPADAGCSPVYRHLPAAVRLDDTVESIDPGRLPDPEAGRNPEQHRALRDD